MTDLVLGIDLGTSGVRVVALDADNRLVGMASVAMPPPDRHDGRIVQDPAIWWDATDRALSQLFASADPHAVRALAVDGTSGTVLAIDEAGVPVGPASLYNDKGSPDIVTRIETVALLDSAARGATSALARAIELQDRARTARVIHQADWIAARLSGRFDLTDENNALKTGYDPVTRRWPAWIGETGMAMTRLPSVVPAGSVVGSVTSEARDLYGFAPETRVVTGTTDGCAAFLATGAVAPGEAVTSLGTTLVIKLMSDRPIFAPAYGIYSHRIGDAWLAGGASNSGGSALLQFFSAERMAELEAAMDPDRPLGLGFYPLPAPGERFPINDPALASKAEPRPADDADFLQSLLEGVAGVEALGYQRLSELGAPKLTSVRTVGGGARNAAWSRIRERILGVPFYPPAHAEAACGAAILARRGLG